MRLKRSLFFERRPDTQQNDTRRNWLRVTLSIMTCSVKYFLFFCVSHWNRCASVLAPFKTFCETLLETWVGASFKRLCDVLRNCFFSGKGNASLRGQMLRLTDVFDRGRSPLRRAMSRFNDDGAKVCPERVGKIPGVNVIKLFFVASGVTKYYLCQVPARLV